MNHYYFHYYYVRKVASLTSLSYYLLYNSHYVMETKLKIFFKFCWVSTKFQQNDVNAGRETLCLIHYVLKYGRHSGFPGFSGTIVCEQHLTERCCPQVRARRLMKELREIQRVQAQQRHEPVFTVELVNDNLFEWHVRLYRVDADSELAGDMREMGVPCILLHLAFPDNFPFAPPFMRVISPRIEKGFVMEGGAICMELLTPRGWASAYTVEAVVMQFAASIVKGQVIRLRHPKKGKIIFIPQHSLLSARYTTSRDVQRLRFPTNSSSSK